MVENGERLGEVGIFFGGGGNRNNRESASLRLACYAMRMVGAMGNTASCAYSADYEGITHYPYYPHFTHNTHFPHNPHTTRQKTDGTVTEDLAFVRG